MARLNTMPEPMRSHLADLPCPAFDTRPWMTGPPLSRRRVAITSDLWPNFTIHSWVLLVPMDQAQASS